MLSKLAKAKEENRNKSARQVCQFLNETLDQMQTAVAPQESVCDPDYETEKLLLPNMVDKVVASKDGGARQFDLDATKMRHNNTEITKTVEDVNRPLKDIATDIVVNEFFKTEETLFRFVSFVYKMFVEALRLYRLRRNISHKNMFIVYKGGNILRLVSREFLLELPASATRQITEFYAPFFKRSDSDFSIYIHPELPDYETVHYEITLLAYLLQDEMRSWFTTHLTYYFDLFRYSTEFQKQTLRPYLEKFNAVEAFANQFEDFKIGNAVAVGERKFCYSANPDVTLKFENPDEDWLKPSRTAAVAEIRRADRNIMTITHNSTLDFPGGSTAVRQRFNLTRTKFIFTLLKTDGTTQNVGGELIDISVPHRLDVKIPHLFEHVTTDITRYTLQSTGCNLTFYAPSLHYMTLDLEDVLFVQRFYPWEDRKYTKRLNRLFYMYFIDIFVQLEDGTAKVQLLQDFKNLFHSLADASSNGVFDFQNAKTLLDKFAAKENFTESRSLIERLKTLVKKLQNEKGKNVVAFNDMLKTLITNAEFTINAVKKVRQYCSIDGKVSKSAIGQALMHDFV